MHLSNIEKEKRFYEAGTGIITLQHGIDVDDLMLYGWGLTNSSEVKFTSSGGEYGNDCKTHDSKF